MVDCLLLARSYEYHHRVRTIFVDRHDTLFLELSFDCSSITHCLEFELIFTLSSGCSTKKKKKEKSRIYRVRFVNWSSTIVKSLQPWSFSERMPD